MWSEDFQILCVSQGRIHGKTHGCKQSLLNIKKGKYKGEHGGAQVEAGSQECVFLSSCAFKNYNNLWEGRNQVIPIQ
jgi:hypothetical protein